MFMKAEVRVVSTDFCVLTYESCYYEIVLDLFHFSEFFRSETFIFNVALRVSKESMECKELPNYFTLGPEKFLLDARQTAKSF